VNTKRAILTEKAWIHAHDFLPASGIVGYLDLAQLGQIKVNTVICYKLSSAFIFTKEGKIKLVSKMCVRQNRDAALILAACQYIH
jgi:hypothetical protein